LEAGEQKLTKRPSDERDALLASELASRSPLPIEIRSVDPTIAAEAGAAPAKSRPIITSHRANVRIVSLHPAMLYAPPVPLSWF
jgi:hypothetical protein